MAKILKINSDDLNSNLENTISVGVVSTGYLTSQQKWIVKSYCEILNQNKDFKFLIVSCYINVGVFKHLSSVSDNLKLVDWNHYLGQKNDAELVSLAKNYHVVFWDFPEIEYLKKHDQAFSPYISHIQDLKILSSNSDQKIFPQFVRQYFREHGLPLEERKLTRDLPNSTMIQRISRLFSKAS